MHPRRPIRDMSQRRRHEGLSPIELHSLQEALKFIVQLLQLTFLLPIGVAKVILFTCATALFNSVTSARQTIYHRLDIINPINRDRDIASFSEEECWDFFRFRRDQLSHLALLLQLPQWFICENGCTCPREHALCVYLYHLSYPTRLQRIQNVFGRELSQLSRIENRIKSFLITRHRAKVVGNLDWYADRFDMYADAYNRAIAYSTQNRNPGTMTWL